MQSAQHLQNPSGNSLRKKLAKSGEMQTLHLSLSNSIQLHCDKRPCKLPAFYLKDEHFLKLSF